MNRCVLLAAVLLLGSAACGREEAASEAEPTGGAFDGLSREEIREQAEAMSPEQAEELGIVDTTIHVERLTSPEDSALMPDTLRLRGRDTAR